MNLLPTRFGKFGVLAAVLACSLVFAMPSGAVTGGSAVSPAPSWSAYIVVKHGGLTSVCSGSLVGSRWVLTAAQCVAGTTTSPCAFSKAYPASGVTVYLGRTGNAVKGKAYKVAGISLHGPSATSADDQCVLKNDIALLHLSIATSRAPLWLAPNQAALINGTGAALYGYGLTDPNNATSYGSLQRTNDGEWSIDNQCDLASLIAATCVDQEGGSSGTTGDAGGPWTMTVDGNPVEALVYSGFDAEQGVAYGTGVAQTATAAWLRAKLGIPTVAPGNIVRAGASSWLISPQGYRRPIPDAATYSCLTGKGAKVTTVTAATVKLMPARIAPASCATGDNVLIAGTGDGGWTAPDDSLAILLTNAGYQVTESATLPSDLSSFGQVWWVDTDPPSTTEQNQLVAFEQAGGGVFLTGELPSLEQLDAADTTMIDSMVVGGGVTAGGQGDVCGCNSALPIGTSLSGNLSSAPFAIDSWTPSHPGGLSGVADSSVFAYYQPGDASTRQVVAAAWDRSSLVGNGRLVVFMDINWVEPGYRGANWRDVAQNVSLFLSGLSFSARSDRPVDG